MNVRSASIVVECFLVVSDDHINTNRIEYEQQARRRDQRDCLIRQYGTVNMTLPSLQGKFESPEVITHVFETIANTITNTVSMHEKMNLET